MLGRRQGNQKIDLKPIDEGTIHAPGGGVTVPSSLNNNRFGCTMADGQFGEVEVSSGTLTDVGGLTQRTIDVFVWQGPGRFAPY